MTLDLKTVWAVSATATALLLAGVMLGKSFGSQQALARVGSTASEPGGQVAEDPYRVPQWLADLPKEWRTEARDTMNGYAVLFDYERRELLVDRCEHRGYFDLNTQLPREESGMHCQRVLTSRLLAFEDQGVQIKSQSGAHGYVQVQRISSSDDSRIRLSFGDHTMALIPGQTNDLSAQIERQEHVAQQQHAYIQYEMRKYDQRRALANANSQQKSTPSFSLPAEVIEEHARVRAEDEKRHP